MLEVPPHFFDTFYESCQVPGVANGLSSGANCQQFCYELLRHFGFEVGPLRSTELWEDLEYSLKVENPQALDLILLNSTSESFGAHMGICLGEDRYIHLSKKNGKPVICSMSDFLKLDEYKFLIGFKRPIKKAI